MPKVKEILIYWVHSKTCPKLRVLKTKEVLAWCYRQDQKAKMNCHLHSKGKQFWRQSHPLFDVCNSEQNLNNRGQSFITSSTESELQTQKLGWSYLYLTVRVTMVIDPFSSSPTYSSHAETLEYFGLKNGSERAVFESDFIFYFYKEFYSFWNTFIMLKPKRFKLLYF